MKQTVTPLLFSLMACAALLGGCASTQTADGQEAQQTATPQTPEEIVQARAAARLQAIKKGEWEKAWSYTTEEYRERTGFDNFRKLYAKAPGNWIEAMPNRASCDTPERCIVSVFVRVKTAPGLTWDRSGVASTYYDEPWVLQNGVWLRDGRD